MNLEVKIKNMKKKAFVKELVDPETGEVINVLMIGKKREFYDKGYAKFFLAFLEDIITDKTISGKAITLILYIAQKLDWNTKEVYLYQPVVCEELKISKVIYYLWLNKLIDKGIIAKTGKKYIYKLASYTIVKGIEMEIEQG